MEHLALDSPDNCRLFPLHSPASDPQPERDKCSSLRLVWAWRGALGRCGEQLMKKKKVVVFTLLKLPGTVTITLWPTKAFPGLACVMHAALLWWRGVSLTACFTAPQNTASSHIPTPGDAVAALWNTKEMSLQCCCIAFHIGSRVAVEGGIFLAFRVLVMTL